MSACLPARLSLRRSLRAPSLNASRVLSTSKPPALPCGAQILQSTSRGFALLHSPPRLAGSDSTDSTTNPAAKPSDSQETERRLAEFRATLARPDRELVDEEEIFRLFGLRVERPSSDAPQSDWELVKHLQRHESENPYRNEWFASSQEKLVSYWLDDIVPIAVKKIGPDKLLTRYAREVLGSSGLRSDKIFGSEGEIEEKRAAFLKRTRTNLRGREWREIWKDVSVGNLGHLMAGMGVNGLNALQEGVLGKAHGRVSSSATTHGIRYKWRALKALWSGSGSSSKFRRKASGSHYHGNSLANASDRKEGSSYKASNFPEKNVSARPFSEEIPRFAWYQTNLLNHHVSKSSSTNLLLKKTINLLLYPPKPPSRTWYSSPTSQTTEGLQSLQSGLLSNLAILLIKISVYSLTRSQALYAEMLHSAADVFNYSYRMLELKRTTRQTPTLTHPYGYAPLRYITADRSFVLLGVVGGGVPLVAGLGELVAMRGGEAAAEAISLGSLAPAVAVFGAGIALEGRAALVSWREIENLAGKSRLLVKDEAEENITTASRNVATNGNPATSRGRRRHRPNAETSEKKLEKIGFDFTAKKLEKIGFDFKAVFPLLLANLKTIFSALLSLPSTLKKVRHSVAAFKKRNNRTLLYIKRGKDVMSVATFLEASSGVVGGSVGILGLLASYRYQSMVCDVGASLVISTLVSSMAAFLLSRTQVALLGQSLPEHLVVDISRRVRNFKTVSELYDIKTEILGTDTVRFKAEIRFNPEGVSGKKTPGGLSGVESDAEFYVTLTKELKEVEGSIKRELKREFKHVHVDLEPM